MTTNHTYNAQLKDWQKYNKEIKAVCTLSVALLRLTKETWKAKYTMVKRGYIVTKNNSYVIDAGQLPSPKSTNPSPLPYSHLVDLYYTLNLVASHNAFSHIHPKVAGN